MTATLVAGATEDDGPSSQETIRIAAPKFDVARFTLVGITPYVQAKFAQKARQMMVQKHTKGSQAGKGTKKAPRDFDADYKGAMHLDADGRHGIPAAAFRNAMIDACRMVGFKMTHAKMSVFVQHDTVDADDGTPLVFILGKPEKVEHAVRNATGVADIRVRPMWREWTVAIRVQFDAEQFSVTDVANLLMRAGISIGVGEGRPFSKESAGQGWGQFEIKEGK